MPWGPSDAEGIRAATEDDIHRIVEEFADAAVRAQAAGFDGVEVHAGHGYLFTAFLSATSRATMPGAARSNTGRACCGTPCAPSGPAWDRGSPWASASLPRTGARRGVSTWTKASRWPGGAAAGVDFIHLSLWQALANSTKYPGTHPLPLFRQAVPPPVAILAAGSIWTLDEAEAVLALGAVAVALGRAAIANPDWAHRAADPPGHPAAHP